MTTLREIGQDWDEQWDALAGESAEAGFMQSSAWTAFKRSEGYLTPRYGLFAEDALWGGASLLLYPAEGGAGFVVCPEGPVLDWHDTETARQGLRLIRDAAETIAAQHGALGLRIEPHLPPPRPSLLRNWSRAPVDLTPLSTLLLDVTLSEAELRAQMLPKGRYNLALSERHGVSVRESRDMADLRSFYALFEATARRNEFFAEPYGFFLNLGATHFPKGRASLFFADYAGETLAAILVLFFGRRATYLYGGSSTQHRNVMPNYALHRDAIRAARREKCVEYDLYGYDPFGLPAHQYAGISRFKKQWGGVSRDSMGAYDHIFYDRLADRLVDALGAPNLRGTR